MSNDSDAVALVEGYATSVPPDTVCTPPDGEPSETRRRLEDQTAQVPEQRPPRRRAGAG
ncbi:MAG: hypothetical protein J4G09_08170 [Proteobacteria bacterium]|nr:hypothetical protein [Pseudomonadota bacterium]